MRAERVRYHVDLPALQAECEANYHRLCQLLTCWQQGSLRRIAFSQDDQAAGSLLTLEVLEESPYTHLVRACQELPATPWIPTPELCIRIYHDARLAEVTAARHVRYLQGVYDYPNPDMHHPDEKAQLNAFLGEWLGHALNCGHLPEHVF